jgi:urease alpha subunit
MLGGGSGPAHGTLATTCTGPSIMRSACQGPAQVPGMRNA